MQMTTPPMMTRTGTCEVGYYTDNSCNNHTGPSEDRHRTTNDDISVVDADEVVATAIVFCGRVIVEDRDDATQGTSTASNAANGTPTTTTSSDSNTSTVYWTPPNTERIRNIVPTLSLSTRGDCNHHRCLDFGARLPMFPSLDNDDDGIAVAALNDTGSTASSNNDSNTDAGLVVVDLPEATVIQVYDDDTDVWYEASEFVSTPTPTATTGHAVLASTTTTSSTPTAYTPHPVNPCRNLTPVFEILAEVSTASVSYTDNVTKTKKRKI